MHTIARDFFIEVSVSRLPVLTAEVGELFHGGQLEGRRGLPRKFMIPGAGNGQPFVANKIERHELSVDTVAQNRYKSSSRTQKGILKWHTSVKK